ncbi:TSC22 domain family protein 2-like [Biomphalaria glabrata]|uniref:TSC22 domain family protein 2-like n=1 Tax=Biomphalaria glabrata TaxID=6526 RepID=A0A9U8EN58_BIOGL|nr:TSC22 domain family protein 2-like [Biomphalaria glabrata]
MASKKHNDIQVSNSSIHTEALKTHSTNINSSKMESVNITNVTNENDRNSNLSPSKSADPARKKTFKIISVKKGGSGSGDLAGDNDGDSIDGLDESQTEDLSSEFYDSSKATDLDMDFQDNLMPLTPDEVTSSTTIVVKTKPDRDAQSRFKVVKIETKEPFRRGKWICYDFFDTAPASLVAVEKNGSRITDESIITSALSGNLSSSSSVHYLHDVNDSSSNIYVSPFVPISPAGTDGQVFPDVFVPIQPAPASQVLNQYDGISSAEAVAPFIAQQVFMSMAGVPTSSTSFYSLAQPGHMAIIQSLPTTNVFPYNAQNGPLPTLYQNGISGPATLPDSLIVSSGTIPSVIPPGITSVPPVAVADVPVVNPEQSQGFVVVGGVTVPHSQSQTQISGVPLVSQILPPVNESLQAGASGLVNAASIPPSGTTDVMTTSGTLEVEQMGSGMDESTGSIKTLQGDPEDHPPQGLEEAVETMYKGLEGVEDEVDERRTHRPRTCPSNIRPSALPNILSSKKIGSPSFGRQNSQHGSRNSESPSFNWPSAIPSHLDSRNLDSPTFNWQGSLTHPHEPHSLDSPSHMWPNVIPSYLNRRNLDSPCNFYFTPVGARSLCSSPVPPSFIEHFDPNYSMTPGMFPPSSTSYFPYIDPNSQTGFSHSSAFVPLNHNGSSSISNLTLPSGVLPDPKPMSFDHPVVQLPTVKIDTPESRSSPQPSLSSPTPQNNLNPDRTAFKSAGASHGNRAVVEKEDKINELLVSAVLPLKEHPAEDGGGSTVAIDNKIEQAMDLVKRHLMYAVREEVEILKQQIGEMMERIGQLEYENTVLKAEAKPETLNKLLQPRAPTAAPLTAPVSVMSTQSQQQTNTMQSAAPQSQTQVQIQTPASAPAVVVQQQSAQQAQLPQSQASQPSLQAPHPPT